MNRRSYKLSKFTIRHGCLVEKKGWDVDYAWWYCSSVEGVFLKPSKGFGPPTQIQFPPPFFVHHLLPRFAPGPVRYVVHAVGSVVLVTQVLGFDLAVGFVKARAENVLYSIVNVESQPSLLATTTIVDSFFGAIVTLHASNVNHARMVLLIGIGMRFQLWLYIIVIVGIIRRGCIREVKK